MSNADRHEANERDGAASNGGPNSVLLTHVTDQRDEFTSGAWGRHTTPLHVGDCAVPSHLTFPLNAHAVRIFAGSAPTALVPTVGVDVPPQLRTVAPRRLDTLLAGRYCAMRALVKAGAPDATVRILRDDDGAPRWPAGFVGSISHTAHRAIAVVAPDTLVRAVGVDCEHVITASDADGIAERVAPEIQLARIVGHRATPLGWPALVSAVFSAKESLYKCLHPLVEAFFDFDEAHLVRVNLTTSTLRLRLARRLAAGFDAGREFDASFSVDDDLVVTSVVVGTQIAAESTDFPGPYRHVNRRTVNA